MSFQNKKLYNLDNAFDDGFSYHCCEIDFQSLVFELNQFCQEPIWISKKDECDEMLFFSVEGARAFAKRLNDMADYVENKRLK